ncbi:hypothetical protein JKF63_00097 [Porcisia hertigi]|uniref:Uncharacterized protein n=1 Tax=Porcisia hertigi TaxID=2761500 RepID=A0A836HYF8_9TRYP|nr:hypothetical protein JKF63_00097 [Porcisia hertigi]
MRSLRSRIVGAFLSPHSVPCCNGNAPPSRPVWRCVNTATRNTQLNPAPDYGAAPLKEASTSLLSPVGLPLNSRARGDSTVLFSRLSQRQMRQRQRKWGILWRYQFEKNHSHRTMPSTPRATASPPSATPTLHSEDFEGGGSADGAQCAREQGAAVKAAFSSHNDCLTKVLADSGVSGDTVAGPYTRTSGAAFVDCMTPGSAHGSVASTSSEGDPLLAFLGTHEEDAALLLAMWTSLHRSCVFGSALSESLVLQVRYLLHSLLRCRAIGAAVRFYHWLTGIGVQFHHSDLLFLFSSLTYENVSTTNKADSPEATKTVAMKKDRDIWTERRQRFRTSTKRARAPDDRHQSQQNSFKMGEDGGPPSPRGTATLPEQRRCAPVFGEDDPTLMNRAVHESIQETNPGGHVEGDTHIAEVNTGSTSSAISCDHRDLDGEVRPPGSIARRVAFHEQPEWIKRWILYEASMGTLDAIEGAEDDGHPGALPTVNIQHTFESPNRVQADLAALSEDPVRTMEVAAIVEHLHLLTLGAMHRDHLGSAHPTASPLLSQLRRRRPLRQPRLPPPAKSYWKEALQVVRTTYALSPWATGVGTSCGTSSPPAIEKMLLPSGIALTLQSMLREAHSWRGAFALLRLTAPETKGRAGAQSTTLRMTSDCFQRGAILFMALAAPAQPWKTQATIDEWMHRVMLPQLARHSKTKAESSLGTMAATAALHALWLSHLCGVKASQPDEFVTRIEEAAAYLTSASAQRVIHGELTLMTSEVRSSTEQAVETLQKAVREAAQNHRASEAVAKSIRTGAYRVERIEHNHELTSVAETPLTVDLTSIAPAAAQVAAVRGMTSPSARPHTPRVTSTSPELLSSDVVDAFALCCAAVKETVWLQFTTAASVNCATATVVEVLQFLERSVHGPTGLVNVFQLLYGSLGSHNGLHDKKSPLTPTVNTSSATERGYISCLFATTLLEVMQLLCSPPTQQLRRFGSRIWNGPELVLLLEMAVKLLNGVVAEDLRQAPWRWTVQQRLKELAHATAGAMRTVMREFNINRLNERVIFGAMTDQDVQLLTLLAQVFHRASELTVVSGASDATGWSSQSPVWRILTSTCSPRTLQGAHLCFGSTHALGKRVRQRLCRRDSDNLDHWIQPPRSCQRTSARLRRARGVTLPVPKVSSGPRPAAEAAIVERGVGRDFDLARRLFDSVYKILNRERTTANVGQALERLTATMTDWKASLFLCQLVTKDVALARGTCSVDFFATTLNRVAEDVAKSSIAASPPGRSLSLQESHSRSSREKYSAMATLQTRGPPDLWLRAVEVFWRAVDHAGGSELGASPHSDASTRAASAKPLASHPVTASAQERAVLAQLLLPLMRFSRAVHRRDVGRQWLRVWAAMYAPQEKQSPKWRQQNIEALSLLGEAAALTRCVAEYPCCGSEALLCSVAVRHSDWGAALEALFKTYGTVDERHATQTTYSCEVARTILTLLAKSPMNLSNTAMRLRTVQREVWNTECSLAVVRLLLRGRRWRLALAHVDEAMELPEMQRVRALVLVDPTGLLRQERSEASPTETTLAHYAHLLAAALQAAAIGGDSAHAPAYYDAFKALLRYVFGEVIDRHTQDSEEDIADEGDIDGLDAALNMTQVPFKEADHASHVEDSVQKTLRELAPRARIFFFRAMTKKMFSSEVVAR